MIGIVLAMLAAGATEPEVAEVDGAPMLRVDPLHEAAMLLSHYPAGLVPLEPATLRAITDLARYGDRSEISLLRNLAENESPEIGDAAMLAIGEIRDRQVDEQRLAFAQTLPNWPELTDAANPFRRAGLGREEARCASYAKLLLAVDDAGDSFLAPATSPSTSDADPWLLLAQGRARKALTTVKGYEGDEARLLEARAHEEIGDVQGALMIYSLTAATGNPSARSAIDGFGVDAERLLLGMLVQSSVKTPAVLDITDGNKNVQDDDDIVLDVLVRHGSHLTVAVLAERARRDDGEALIAVTALAKMLDGTVRDAPLRSPSQRVARKALVLASREGSDAIKQHVAKVFDDIEDPDKR